MFESTACSCIFGRRLSSFEGCKWVLARDASHFCERAHKEADKAVLLCATGDLTDQQWAGVKHRFTTDAALKFIRKVDASSTTCGACGR